jgi:hypothetical protein
MKKILVLAPLAWLVHSTAAAGTGYYVESTHGNEAERTVDYKYWRAKPGGRALRS